MFESQTRENPEDIEEMVCRNTKEEDVESEHDEEKNSVHVPGLTE